MTPSAEKTGEEWGASAPIAIIIAASCRFIVSIIGYQVPRTNPNFRTMRPYRRLAVALFASLALHLLLALHDLDFGRKSGSTAVPLLQAELRPPPPALQAAPPLELPPPQEVVGPPAKKTENPKRPTPAQPSKEKPAPTGDWRQTVRQHIKHLEAAGLFYPREAIVRGEQGEVLVLMVLDESGKVTAARVEEGSGHPLLDEAALRAIRSLSSLPADAPRQVILPVRFRLR